MAQTLARRARHGLAFGALAFATIAPSSELGAAARPTCRAAATRRIGAPAAITQPCRAFAFTGGPTPGHAAKLSKTAIAENDILVRVNAERAARRLPALHLDGWLSVQARGWSYTMSVQGFHHSDLNRLFHSQFNYVGENIAWANGGGATAGLINLMWMRSAGHRENLLATAFDTIGIGVFCAPDGTIWATQNFGRHTSLGSAPPFFVPPQNPIARPDSGNAGC